MKLLKIIRAFWIVFRGGKRWETIRTQSDFWSDRCHYEFVAASEAFDRKDWPEFEKAKERHELSYRRFKKERVLIDV